MTEDERKIIKSFDKCNFNKMAQHLLKDSELKKVSNKLPENRKKKKAEKERLDGIYGYALVDGYLEKVGNYNVEPPTLFRGRGDHPRKGCLKRRVGPEDVTLNIGINQTIPELPAGMGTIIYITTPIATIIVSTCIVIRSTLERCYS